jgi:hypothetical protein
MPGGTASVWAGRSPKGSRPSTDGSCNKPVSAKPRSPASCRSGAPPFARFWREPIAGQQGDLILVHERSSCPGWMSAIVSARTPIGDILFEHSAEPDKIKYNNISSKYDLVPELKLGFSSSQS